MITPIKINKGFSLIELSIVLLVVGLLIGSMVSGFTTYTQNRQIQQARDDLKQIHDALIGFAIQNGRLPCPDIHGPGVVGFGVEDRQGLPNNECTAQFGLAGAQVAIGFLPFVDLGINGTPRDPWNLPYAYAVDRALADTDLASFNFFPPPCPQATDGVTTFGVCARGVIQIKDTGGQGPGVCGALCVDIANNVAAVFYSFGEVSFGAFSVHERENIAAAFGGPASDPDNLVYVSRQYSREGPNRFDDQIMWIPSSILVNRMIQAGRLP